MRRVLAAFFVLTSSLVFSCAPIVCNDCEAPTRPYYEAGDIKERP